jgi:hypothetical protein
MCKWEARVEYTCLEKQKVVLTRIDIYNCMTDQTAYQLLHPSRCRWHVATIPDCDPNVTKEENWEYICYHQTPIKI